MKKRTGSVLLAGFVAAALSPNMVSMAVAAETAASNGDELTEIVVTARRTEENLQDVPISITVFNQQQLQNRNIVNAQDLAAYVPSLSSNSLFGADNSTFAIRGFVQENGTAPSVGVFFADVIMPRAASNSIPGGDGAGPGAFFDLENVQILKGPQGTLFGRNTTGGDILLVPKKPTSELSGFIEGGVGNYDDGEFQAVVNVPINDSFRVRAGVVHETREGYLHDTSGIGPNDFDDVDYTAARLSAVVDILPNLENYTIGSFSITGDNGNVEKLVAAAPALSPFFGPPAAAQLATQGSGFYDAQQSLPYAKSHLEQFQVINTTTWKATDHLTVKNIASYAQLRDTLYSAIFGTNFSIPTDPAFLYGPPAAGKPFIFAASIPFPGGGTSNERTVTEELQFQGDALDSKVTWQGGAYLELALPDGIVGSLSPVGATCADNSRSPTAFACTDNLGYVLGNLLALGGTPIPGGFVPFAVNNLTVGSTNYRDFAFYAQSTYKFNDQFKLTGGIRWTNDHEEADSIQKTYHYLPAPLTGIFPAGGPEGPICTQGLTDARAKLPNCEIDYVQNSRAPTWMIDFDYTPVDNLLLYAKYTRGYREGAINPTIPFPLNNVQPEKVDSYELGEKFSFHGPITGTLNASAFYNDFRNQQIQLGFDQNPASAIIVGPAAGPQNAGKSRIYGAELESSVLLFPGMRLDADYTYLNTRIQAVNLPTLPAASPYIAAGNFKVGDPLALTPKNKVSVTPTYTLALPTTIGTVALSATFTHTDKQLSNYSDREVTSVPAVAALSYLQATNLLNLNVNWANVMGKPVDVNLFATNVTKQEYFTFTSGVGTNGFETANLGPPMMFGVRVKLRYN